MAVHPLDAQLDYDGIITYMDSKTDKFRDMIILLSDTYSAFYGGEEADGNVIRRLMWELIKIDPEINKFFFLRDQYIPELDKPLEIGLASKRIVQLIIEKVKKKYGEEFSSL